MIFSAVVPIQFTGIRIEVNGFPHYAADVDYAFTKEIFLSALTGFLANYIVQRYNAPITGYFRLNSLQLNIFL
jgi:hypothetical protein